MKDVKAVLAKASALIDNDHFVYKAGTHGPAYIDKEKFSLIGAVNFVELLREIVREAITNGLEIDGRKHPTVGVIGPAYGAISFTPTIAAELEKAFPLITFFPARTELITDKTGNKIHVVPEKLLPAYKGKAFVIVEDIVNNGTTIREARKVCESEPVKGEVVAALSIAERGGQTAQSLVVPQFFPLLRVIMVQYDIKKEPCPLCREGIPINTVLGKGKRWAEMFGQPPYALGTDFSSFWQ